MLPEHNGLKANWNFKRIYVNPPYGLDRKRGTGIKDWLYRCAQAHKNFGSEVLALVPVASNTGHWKKLPVSERQARSAFSTTRG